MDGSEYRSAKAGGDMKVKGRPDPYAFLPVRCVCYQYSSFIFYCFIIGRPLFSLSPLGGVVPRFCHPCFCILSPPPVTGPISPHPVLHPRLSPAPTPSPTRPLHQLDPAMLNRRNKHEADHQFDGMVRAAHAGSAKGVAAHNKWKGANKRK